MITRVAELSLCFNQVVDYWKNLPRYIITNPNVYMGMHISGSCAVYSGVCLIGLKTGSKLVIRSSAPKVCQTAFCGLKSDIDVMGALRNEVARFMLDDSVKHYQWERSIEQIAPECEWSFLAKQLLDTPL